MMRGLPLIEDALSDRSKITLEVRAEIYGWECADDDWEHNGIPPVQLERMKWMADPRDWDLSTEQRESLFIILEQHAGAVSAEQLERCQQHLVIGYRQRLRMIAETQEAIVRRRAEDLIDQLDCTVCGGSGGGDAPMQCTACGGTGLRVFAAGTQEANQEEP